VTECPHCGQPVLVRFGVRLPPKKASILDMIQNITKGRGGIEAESLGWIFYPGEPKRVATQRIKAHVCQINDLLVETEWKIENSDGLYRLTREAT
jgi:hypothetical protein